MIRSARLLTIVLALFALLPASVLAARYTTIDGPRVGDDPDTIEVIEFFWYGCPHCYRFSPYIDRWKQSKPADVRFRHLPAILSPRWELHAKAFFAADIMGELERFHPAMFAAIHDNNRRLDSVTAIGDFAGSHGLDAERFVATMKSFAVDTRVRRVKNLQRAYGVTGTPTVVIDGRYRTSGSSAGGVANMIPVINERIEALRAGTD